MPDIRVIWRAIGTVAEMAASVKENAQRRTSNANPRNRTNLDNGGKVSRGIDLSEERPNVAIEIDTAKIDIIGLLANQPPKNRCRRLR